MADAVRPGGSVFFGDKTRAARIVDRPRSSIEVRQAFTATGFDVEVVVVGDRFSAVIGLR